MMINVGTSYPHLSTLEELSPEKEIVSSDVRSAKQHQLFQSPARRRASRDSSDILTGEILVCKLDFVRLERVCVQLESA